MFKRFKIWLKKIWGKLFRRSAPYTVSDLNVNIVHQLYKLALKERVSVYSGSPAGLREALSNQRSFVYVIEVTNPVDKKKMIQFDDYIKKLIKNKGGK